MFRFLFKVYNVLTGSIAIFFILNSKKIQKSYNFGFVAKISLGFKMFLNMIRIPTGTSFKTHLVMALKILETSPDIKGDIMECGTWKGGCAANLSLVCKIVGRKLLIYDSFEGLPCGVIGDREAKNYTKGDYCGSLEEVKNNISRYGEIKCCEFVKGWFEETMPLLNSPILLAFIDVDLEASLEICVRKIWPKLIDKGYIFIDEVVGTDYCALFYSEKWWNKNFRITPPGLIGAGSGLPLGEFYIGPWSEKSEHPLWSVTAGAFTSKGMSGYWSYYPDEN